MWKQVILQGGIYEPQGYRIELRLQQSVAIEWGFVIPEENELPTYNFSSTSFWKIILLKIGICDLAKILYAKNFHICLTLELFDFTPLTCITSPWFGNLVMYIVGLVNITLRKENCYECIWHDIDTENSSIMLINNTLFLETIFIVNQMCLLSLNFRGFWLLKGVFSVFKYMLFQFWTSFHGDRDIEWTIESQSSGLWRTMNRCS